MPPCRREGRAPQRHALGGGAGTSRADGWEGRAPARPGGRDGARPSRGMERNLKPRSGDLIISFLRLFVGYGNDRMPAINERIFEL